MNDPQTIVAIAVALERSIVGLRDFDFHAGYIMRDAKRHRAWACEERGRAFRARSINRSRARSSVAP